MLADISVINKIIAKKDFFKYSDKEHIICKLFSLLKNNGENISQTPFQVKSLAIKTTTAEEFDGLLLPKNHKIRSHDYGFYLTNIELLSTHPTRYLPFCLQDFAQQNKSEQLWYFPGRCFVRNGIGKQRTITPHKLDIWYITSKKNIDCSYFIKNIFADIFPYEKIYLNTKIHPYTENGFSVEFHDDMIYKIAEGGYISAELMLKNGLDPNKYTGIGVGLGLERLAMAKKRIKDIRLLYSNEQYVKSQMDTLDYYDELPNYRSLKYSLQIPFNFDMSVSKFNEILIDKLDSFYHNIEQVDYDENNEVTLTFSRSDKNLSSDEVHLVLENSNIIGALKNMDVA